MKNGTRRGRAGCRGASLMDGLLLACLACLVAAVALPHFRIGRLLRREGRIAEAVEALSNALLEARARAVQDADGDGSGEFPPLTSILGPGRIELEPVEGTSVHEYAGYYFALLLPDLRGDPVPDTSPAVHTDYAEFACVLTAWPVERGTTGMRAYCWRPADGLLKHAVDGYPYGGADRPIVPDGPLVAGAWPDWRAGRYQGDDWIHRR